MKEIIAFLFFIIFALNVIEAQNFNYQSIVRNSSGNPLINSPIFLRLTVLSSETGGTVLYRENHNIRSDQFGWISVNLGKGIPVAGNFSSIDFSTQRHMLIECSPTEGGSYTIIGGTPLSSSGVGPKGDTGAIGPQGAKGDKGDRGDQGPAGVVGPTGPKGDKGDAGSGVKIVGSLASVSALPTPYTGAVGDMYITQDNGNGHVWTGTSWTNVGQIRGPVGPAGSQGQAGAQGAIGPKGDKGDKGDRGDQGPAGAQGQAGPQGSDGPKGDTGATGPAGTYTAGSGIDILGSTIKAIDTSSTNEIQTLSLEGNSLSLSRSGGTVMLPSGGGLTLPYIGSGNTTVNAPLFRVTQTGGDGGPAILGVYGSPITFLQAGVAGVSDITHGVSGSSSSGSGFAGVFGFGQGGAYGIRGTGVGISGGAFFNALGSGNALTTQGKTQLGHNSSIGSPNLEVFEYEDDFARISLGNTANSTRWHIAGRGNDGITGANSSRLNFYFQNDQGGADRMTLLGNGNLGIGTTSPTAKLEIAGQVKITEGSPGEGKVLTSDASGLGTWRTLSGGTNNAWLLAGNAGTNPSNHFIGTTDNQPIGFKTNNVTRMEIKANGIVAINSENNISTLEFGQNILGKQMDAGKIQYGGFGEPTHTLNIVGGGTNIEGLDRKVKIWSEGGTLLRGSLDITGGIRIQGIGPGVGKVLTSDANGNATWQTPAVGGSGTTYTAGGGINITGSTISAVDNSATNEIQTLSLSGNSLSLSLGGGSIPLPMGGGTSYTGGTGISINASNQIINTGDTDPTNDITITTIADGDLTGTFDNLRLKDFSITPTKIENGAVLGSKIAQSGASTGQVLGWSGMVWTPMDMQQSQLESIIENGKKGWRLLGQNPNNYGDIGQGAVDLSISGSPSSINGATGTWSTAFGLNTTASGENGATAFGLSTKATGDNGATSMGVSSTANGNWGATAMGYTTMANGQFGATAMGLSTNASGNAGATALGDHTIASGNAGATALGNSTIASSFSSLAAGMYNDTIIGSSRVSWVATDPILTIGNGIDKENRRNAVTVYKNGNTDLNGFVRLGKESDGAPRIKMKEFIGITSAINNGLSIPIDLNGISAANVLSVSVFANVAGNFIPPLYDYDPRLKYNYFIHKSDVIYLVNSSSNCTLPGDHICNKNVKVLVTYKE